MRRSMTVRVVMGAVGLGMWLGAIAPVQAAYPTADPVLIPCVDLLPEPPSTASPSPDQAELLGDYRLCAHDPTAAIDLYQTAVTGYRALGEEADSQTTIAIFKLARALLTADRPTEALAAYREAIARDPDYGFLPLFLERQVSPLGEPVTDAGLRGDANAGPLRAESSIEASAYFEMAYDLDRLGRGSQGLQAYRQAVMLQPNFAEAHFAIGQIQYKMMDFAAARASYQAALRAKPDFLWARYRLGYLLAWRFEPEAALQEFRQVIAAHTGLDTLGEAGQAALAQVLLGDVYRDQGNPPPAIAAYRQAIALAPQDAGVYLRLGQVSAGTPEAIAAYRQALAQLPPDAIERQEAEYGIASALVAMERWAEARIQLQQILERWPDSASTRQLLEYVNSRPR